MDDIQVGINSQRLIDSHKNRYIVWFDFDGDDMIKLEPSEIKERIINRIKSIDESLLKAEWQ